MIPQRSGVRWIYNNLEKGASYDDDQRKVDGGWPFEFGQRRMTPA